jgi:hypothetical protein
MIPARRILSGTRACWVESAKRSPGGGSGRGTAQEPEASGVQSVIQFGGRGMLVRNDLDVLRVWWAHFLSTRAPLAGSKPPRN